MISSVELENTQPEFLQFGGKKHHKKSSKKHHKKSSKKHPVPVYKGCTSKNLVSCRTFYVSFVCKFYLVRR